MKLKLGPYFDGCLALLVILAVIGSPCLAQETDINSEYDINTPVELHLRADPHADYSERRSDWSWRFSSMAEYFLPNQYVSPADGSKYKPIFGNHQATLVSASIGTQYNTRIGGFFVDAIYGLGSITGLPGASTLLKVTKYGGTFGIMFDTLFRDPYVSPFAGVQAISMNWAETDTNINIGGTTSTTTAVIAGLAIHMNQIDSDSASQAYMDYGIRNTFLDLYGISYNLSTTKGDPNFSTAFNFGAGFHLEF